MCVLLPDVRPVCSETAESQAGGPGGYPPRVRRLIILILILIVILIPPAQAHSTPLPSPSSLRSGAWPRGLRLGLRLRLRVGPRADCGRRCCRLEGGAPSPPPSSNTCRVWSPRPGRRRPAASRPPAPTARRPPWPDRWCRGSRTRVSAEPFGALRPIRDRNRRRFAGSSETKAGPTARRDRTRRTAVDTDSDTLSSHRRGDCAREVGFPWGNRVGRAEGVFGLCGGHVVSVERRGCPRGIRRRGARRPVRGRPGYGRAVELSHRRG